MTAERDGLKGSGKGSGEVEVFTSFPGGSLGDWRIRNGILAASLRREPLCRADGLVHDYGVHFLFGISNRSNERVILKCIIGGVEGPQRPEFDWYIYTGARYDAELSPAARAAKTDGYKYFRFPLELEAGETRFVSNTFWRPYEIVMNRVEDIARGSLQRVVYGTSIEGRELVAYRFGPSQCARHTLLVTSGFHPMEPDTLGTERVLKWLVEHAEQLGSWLEVWIVPVVNPDGFLRGFGGCNAAGLNLFWDFRADERGVAPEANHLWNLIRSVQPTVYVDFHCYTIQGPRKLPGPYLKPVSTYQGRAARRLARRLEGALLQIPGTAQVRVAAPSTLSHRLTAEFNTWTAAKYHLHLGMGGPDGCRQMAGQVIEQIVDTLSSAAETRDELLLKPYGSVSPARLELTLRRIWAERDYRVRQLKGRIRGKPFDRRSRKARLWSNSELRRFAPLIPGAVANVSAWRDEDKEGNRYRDYFSRANSYSITNWHGVRGYTAHSQHEVLLDLEAQLPADMVGRFDAVFSHTTLEHIYDVAKAFSNLCLLSRDLVILVVPFLQELHFTIDYGDYWRFTPHVLRRLFLDQGLELLYESCSPFDDAAKYLFVVASRHPERWASILPNARITQRHLGRETTGRGLRSRIPRLGRAAL